MVISDMKPSNCHKGREYNLNTPKAELLTAVKVKDLHTAVEGCTMARGESSGGFGGSSGEAPKMTTNTAKDGGGSGGGLDRDGEGAVTIEAMDEPRRFFKGSKSGRQS
ncbi:hypothetical protein F2Q68_00046485 [Brassica cretica]|uniref:Uncharacterized protein n=2 Tax=Brassica cretica TaxID=69181 RepID=A0A8S9LK38_BRACR|nr:hypothetical protein F2Q68_00046485 [Brassica cretica]KAF3520773.1 hypothetical protein DY000_02063974 [Brassica cretica]